MSKVYRAGRVVMMPVSAQVIVGCWVVFIVYWIISARSVKPVADPPTFLSTLAYRVPLVDGGFLICRRQRS
jgi:hypothetical protein